MFGPRPTRFRRARLVPLAITTAALSSAVLGASVTGTLSAFQASITNSQNTATTGSLVMQETDSTGHLVCSSTQGDNNTYATCTGVDKYGGTTTPFTPGTTHATTVYIGNAGVSDVKTFTVEPGVCTMAKAGAASAQASGDLCQSLQLTLTCRVRASTAPYGYLSDSATVFDRRPLRDLEHLKVDLAAADKGCKPASSGASGVQLDFSLTLPDGQDNTVQGQSVSQPITWTFIGA